MHATNYGWHNTSLFLDKLRDVCSSIARVVSDSWAFLFTVCHWMVPPDFKPRSVWFSTHIFLPIFKQNKKYFRLRPIQLLLAHYSLPYSCRAALVKMDQITHSTPQIGLYSFEIFQDDVRPPLGFGSTGSRSTRSANPQNSTLVPNMWSAHY